MYREAVQASSPTLPQATLGMTRGRKPTAKRLRQSQM